VTALLGPDNAGDAITEVVLSAARHLDVAVYEMGPGYAGELATAARRARVRLLLDAHAGDGANPSSLARLEGTAVAVRQLGSRGAEAHWKLIVAGQETLLVGSGNLITRDAPRHAAAPDVPLAGTREWWLEVRGAPALATQARRALDGAWVRAGSEPPRFPVVAAAPLPPPPVGVPFPQVPPFTREVAPERIRLATEAAGCATLLATELAVARRRLLVTVPYVHARAEAVRAPLAQLCEQTEAGVDVRLLLGAVPSDGISATVRELRGLGIAVRVMDPRRTTTGHAKGLVADGAVMVGSSNWSQGGLAGNLEAALVVDDAAVADHYAAAFERDWEASR
jgi:phosphatidylserine/phosphatidylglycerophosphate/cardiolipin synthase-like enzyme